MLPDVPMSSNFDMPLFEFLQRYALSLDDHAALMDYCADVGIQYLCTPFSRKAAEELEGLGVAAYKIGSGELTDIPTLQIIAGFGKPMILSTGMAEVEEIDETVAAILPINTEIALLHCVSEYPARHSDVNLGFIPLMKERYGVVIGHSDHTPDIWTALGAVALGANIIEKHLTLDKRSPGPDREVSIDPSDFAMLVDGVRRIEEALGAEKVIHDLERPIREWAHRSVVALVEIPAGAQITPEMVWTKRPGTGIPARQLREVVGRTTATTIPENSLVGWDQLVT
jgi:N-acetylneuraminate synthase